MHAEERRRREEQDQKLEAEIMEYLEEHSEEIEEQDKWIEEQRIREDERRKTLRELQDIVKKARAHEIYACMHECVCLKE